MTDERVPDTYERRLVVIAISDYDDGNVKQRATFSKGINAQVTVVEDWWASPRLDDQRRFTPSHPPKPLQSVHDLRAFLIDEDLIGAHDDEALVIYVTGHGLAPQGPQHFLRLPDTRTNRPLATAFPTVELITAALDSTAGHVLVMVDSCYSGRLAEELDRSLKALDPERHALSSLVVLVAGNEDSTPRLRAFTSALAAVHAHATDESNGYARSHLSWEDFHTILKAVWDPAQMADVQPLWPPPSVSRQLAARELSPCLPNPGHKDTTLLEEARSQVGWTRTDIDDYWISRATGQMSGDAGWYFTGRTALVARLNAFLDSTDGALIVTGQAGSGKSALLARLVTLSDPRFRDDPTYRPYLEAIPEELQVPRGAIDAAVLARNTDPQELTTALYQALTGRYTPTDGDPSTLLRRHTLDALSELSRPLTVVIDGIDEARNPRRIITDVLRPLAGLSVDGQHAVRLILGIRSSPPATHHTPPKDTPAGRGLLELLQRATNAGTVLRTDDDTAQDDIAAYTASLLQAEPATGSRLADRRNEAEVAATIAQEVTPSFLDARLAAQQLHDRPHLPSPSDVLWRRQLRKGTQELLRQDLADVAQHTSTRPEALLAVLRATAFAQGAGLPWAEVWPAAVRGLEPDCDNPEACIRLVRDSRLTGYLTTAVEDGRIVYRPIHERVSETLRTAPYALLIPHTQPGSGEDMTDDLAADDSPIRASAHRDLTEAFTRLLTDTTGRPPHPYLRRHLIAHAAEGHVLDDVRIPASFLPFESHGRIRGTLGLPVTPTPSTQRLAAWSRIEPFLADAPPTARADSLAMAENAHTGQAAPQPSPLHKPPCLTPRWNRLRLPTNVLASTTSDIYKLVTFHTADGFTIIAAGDSDGSLTMWDAHTGAPFGAPFFNLGRYVRAAASLPADGNQTDPLLVVGSEEGLWRCDPDTGRIWKLLNDRIRALTTFTSPDHDGLLAVATPHEVLTLDPYTGGVIHHSPLRPDHRPVTVNALESVVLPNGRTLLALGQDSSKVPLLDASSLEVVHELPAGGISSTALQAFTNRHGEPRLAIATRSGKGVLIFDPVTGRPHKHASVPQSVASMAIHPGPYRFPLLVTGSSVDGGINVYDTETGQLVDKLPTEHTEPVRSLAFFKFDGNPLIASGSIDGTIRLWDDIAPYGVKHPPAAPPSASPITLIPRPVGPPQLVSADHRGRIVSHSWRTGASEPQTQYDDDVPRRRITALAAAGGTTDDDPALVAVGYSDGSLHLITEEGHRRVLQESEYGARTRARSVLFLPATAQQPRVLVAGFSDSRIDYYRVGGPDDGWRGTLRTDGSVRALAAAPGNDQPLLAVATRAVRLLHPGHAPHARLPQSIGGVRSLAFLSFPTEREPLVATGGSDGAVRLWSPAAPRKEALPVLRGHRGAVSALASLHHPARPQPLLISAGVDDTTIRAWDCQAGEEILRLVTGAPVTALAVLPSDPRDQDSHPTIVFGSPSGIAAATVHL